MISFFTLIISTGGPALPLKKTPLRQRPFLIFAIFPFLSSIAKGEREDEKRKNGQEDQDHFLFQGLLSGRMDQQDPDTKNEEKADPLRSCEIAREVKKTKKDDIPDPAPL